MRQDRQCNTIWRTISLVLMMVLFSPVFVPANAAGSAEGYVGELAQQAIALAQSNPEGRAAQVEQLLDRSTDVPTVGRLVLGRHWALATPAQRDEYLKLFRGYVLAGVSRRLGAARGS